MASTLDTFRHLLEHLCVCLMSNISQLFVVSCRYGNVNDCPNVLPHVCRVSELLNNVTPMKEKASTLNQLCANAPPLVLIHKERSNCHHGHKQLRARSSSKVEC